VSSTVIVVGSINVDLFTYVDRLPRPGETVIGGTYRQAHGGKGANQAVGAARLGADVALVGMVGEDDLGRSAITELDREGVNLDDVRIAHNHTGVAQIMVDAQGENQIAVASGANYDLTGDMVAESLGRVDADKAVVGAVLEVTEEAVLAAATVAAERGWTFVLNPAPARALSNQLLSHVAVLTPNEHEVSELGASSPEDLLDAGAGSVVVTKGSKGADLIRRDMPIHHQPGFEVRAVDTTGAGDSFSGALAWALADGRQLEDAVEFAAASAALSTMHPGARAGMPSRAQTEEFLRTS
jgi:ribokinase